MARHMEDLLIIKSHATGLDPASFHPTTPIILDVWSGDLSTHFDVFYWICVKEKISDSAVEIEFVKNIRDSKIKQIITSPFYTRH